MKEKITEWLFLLATGIMIPCFMTAAFSGMKETVQTDESGIHIRMEDGTVMDREEFLVYMIAGEINLDYAAEAFNAQAVIARTNLMREIGEKTEVTVSELKVSYLEPEKFEESFGERKREQVLSKIRQAVSDTSGQILYYQGEYIDALYHAVSIGNTVSSEELYGLERPYLTEVESSQDVESEEYMTISHWSPKEVLEKLQASKKAMKEREDSILEAIKIKEKTKNGYIKSVTAGEETLSGSEWQELFHLNSSNFYLEDGEGSLRIITLGKGHGMGLSQYGANALAEQGWGYEEILEKYYPGTSLEKTEKEE